MENMQNMVKSLIFLMISYFESIPNRLHLYKDSIFFLSFFEAIMETLVRNATLRFSRRVEGYEPLNPTGQVLERSRDGDDHVSQQQQVSFSRPQDYREDNHGRKSMLSRPKSYRKNQDNNMMKNSLSRRRDRARNRHIFLQSYKLASMETSRKYSKTKKLKRAVVKVKSLVVSVLSFIRGGDSFRSCNSRSAISASLPVPNRVVSCC